MLPVSRLPANCLILQRARSLRLHNCQTSQLSDKEIAHTIALEVENIWNRASIPCRELRNIKTLVLKSMEELNSHMKHWARLSSDKDPLKSFCVKLDHLFDIAYVDLESRMASSGNPRWREDFQFYNDQKKVPQLGTMAGHDKEEQQRVRRRQLREPHLPQPRQEAEQHEPHYPDRDIEPEVACSLSPRKRRQKSSYTVTM